MISILTYRDKGLYIMMFSKGLYFALLLLAFFLFSQESFASSENNKEIEEKTLNIPIEKTTINAWEGVDSSTEIKDVRLYKKDNFRIFYFTDGPNKITPEDLDKNKVPDFVEDVMKQFWATQHLFMDVFGYPQLNETPYYKGVNLVDIYILNSNELMGANGVAMQMPEQALIRPEGELAIKVYLKKGFNFKSSSTITHEFFHLIQNGMTEIHNLWFTEGLARWAEDLLVAKNYQKDPRWDYYKLIKAKDVLKHVQSLSYDAGKFFWIPLTLQFGNNKTMSFQDYPIYTLTYSDGTKVFQDNKIAGVLMIKEILKNLNKADKQIEKDFGFTIWTKKERAHPRNNPYILKAISDAIKSHCK